MFRDEAPQERVSLFEALVGLILEPSQTVESLFEVDPPPYVPTFFLLVIGTIFTPLVAQIYKYNLQDHAVSALWGLIVMFVLALVLFIILESIFLLLMGLNFTLHGLLACIAYSLVPLFFSLWLIYLFNYLSAGRLSLITFLLSGFSSGDDSFLKVLPIVSVVVQLLMLVVYFYAIRAMGAVGSITAFMIAIISLVPLYLALLVGLMVSELLHQGIIAVFLQLLASPELPFALHW